MRAGPARAHDNAGHRVRHLIRRKAGVGNGLLHGNIIPCSARAHETAHALVDSRFDIECWPARDLAAEAFFNLVGLRADAGATFDQAGGNFLRIIANAGHNSHSGNGDMSHCFFLHSVLRVTFAPAGTSRPAGLKHCKFVHHPPAGAHWQCPWLACPSSRAVCRAGILLGSHFATLVR